MNALKRMFLTIAVLMLTGCATISTNGGYTLRSGETLRGMLIVTSGTTTLEEGSRVTGDVYMTSGVLNVHGRIDGDIIFTSGEVNLAPTSVLNGDAKGTSGGVHVEDGAQVKGQISSSQNTFRISSDFFVRLFATICFLPLIFIVAVVFLLGRRKKSRKDSPRSFQPQTTSAMLQQLKQMLEDGLITDADFESKKAEILSSM